jgi:hypothetical protein
MPKPEPGTSRKRSSYMKPLPEERIALAVRITCTPSAFENLKQGNFADMDDKWDVFYEEPWLYLYRGSGYAVFWIRFEPAGMKYGATEAWMTRDPDVMQSDWVWQLGGSNEDANAATLMIKLHALAYRGTNVPPPAELIKRWEQTLSRAFKGKPADLSPGEKK